MSTPTPRTDAVAFFTGCDGREKHPCGDYVQSDFARKLERELAALTAERDQLRAEVQAQCLLNAKGSEREAGLLGRLARAEREIVMLRAANVASETRGPRLPNAENGQSPRCL